MSRHSSIGLLPIMKLFAQHARHPWIAEKLIKLQAEKLFFDVLNPGVDKGEARKIRQLSIRITDVCNLRCIMCGQWGENGFLLGRELKDLKRQEVPVSRYMELVDDLLQHGHKPNVYLWGGEPMLYDGTVELIRHATANGLPCSIATNGTKLDGALEEFVEAPLYLMQVSVDGHNAELHNSIRRSQTGIDSFKLLVRNLERTRELRAQKGSELPLIATLSTVSDSNHDHLVDIYERFAPLADMCVFYLSWWIDEERATAHDKDFAGRFGQTPELHRGWIGGWKPSNYAALSDQLKELRRLSGKRGNPPAIILPSILDPVDLESYYTNHAATFGYDRCMSIFHNVELDSTGNMSPCRDYHDFVVGNVKDETIVNLWNNWLYRKFRRSLHKDGLMPACSRCCGLMGY